MMICKGICDVWDDKLVQRSYGFKYCRTCSKWVQDTKRCNCCHALLRIRSRSSPYRYKWHNNYARY